MSELGDRPGRLGRTLAAMAALALFFVVTRWLREQLGLEMTSDSIRDAVGRLGWWAPLGYLALVSVRQILALPSVLVLGSAGLLFGTVEGALLGGLAITLNALLVFTVARKMGADWVRARLHERFPNFEDRARSAGPLIIALATGHPMGPQTAFHFGAGVTRISVPVFVAVVLPAALFRATCYAYLGANILEPSSPDFWLASGVLIAMSVAPLAHPKLRARLFGTLRRPSPVPVDVPPPTEVAAPIDASAPVEPARESRS
jgi:uncharacterized membrane protein YdjX (TVP38/TMEM64 family)